MNSSTCVLLLESIKTQEHIIQKFKTKHQHCLEIKNKQTKQLHIDMNQLWLDLEGGIVYKPKTAVLFLAPCRFCFCFVLFCFVFCRPIPFLLQRQKDSLS